MADIAQRVLLSTRADVLREIVKREAKLEKKYGRKLAELQRKLRSGTKIQSTINKAMNEIVQEIQPDIERMIETGAIKGKQAARKSFKKLFGSRARASFPTDKEAIADAGRRIRGATTVDKVSLSKRLWRSHQKLGKDMGIQVQASMRAGKSMSNIADELLARGRPKLAPPAYAKKLADAARRGGDELTRVAKKYEKQLSKLGSRAGDQFSMRPVARQLQAELRKARPDQVDKIVKQFMDDKARRHARMIARSESIEAYRDSYRKSTEDQDWVKGYRWNLGAGHPRPDECDILAGQDLYGLGDGGYPVDGVPDTPHPNDMCYQTAIIDTDHFKREKAIRNDEKPPPEPWKSGKRETSEQWLKKQSAAKQKQILGPTKYDRFKRTPGQVLGKDGIPKRVKDLKPVPRAAAPPKPTVSTAPQKPAPTKPRVKEIETDYDFSLKHPPKGAPKILPEQRMRSGMTLDEVEKTIRSSAVEQGAIFDKSGNLIARGTSYEKGRVYWPEAVIDDSRIKGALHTHSHPTGQAALSPGDVFMAHANQLGEMRAVVADGRVARLVVTDPVKWANPKAADAIIRTGDKIKNAAELPFAERIRLIKAQHARTLTKEAHRKAADRFNKRLMAAAQKEWSALGRRYGFKYELIISK